MAKKKDVPSETPRLAPATYWEWRCCINEMDVARKDLDIATLKYETMLKDQEIARLKSSLFKVNISSIESKLTLTKEEYHKMKQKIEAEIGCTLDGKVIDDINYEIKPLD